MQNLNHHKLRYICFKNSSSQCCRSIIIIIDRLLVVAVSFSLLKVYNRLTAIWQCILVWHVLTNHHTKQKNNNERKKHSSANSCRTCFHFGFVDFQIFTQCLAIFLFFLALHGCSIENSERRDRQMYIFLHLDSAIHFYCLNFRFQSHDNVVVNCSNRSLLPNNPSTHNTFQRRWEIDVDFHRKLNNNILRIWIVIHYTKMTVWLQCYTVWDDQLDVEHNSNE